MKRLREIYGLKSYRFLAKIPGKEGTVDKTYAGQMDVIPTILHLVGIDSKTSLMFGTDMLSKS